MGYSCTVKADLSLKAIYAALQSAGEQSANCFEYKGSRFFIEQGGENEDGAITATIYKFVGSDSCRKAGSLRIEANGGITRPVWMRNAAYERGFLQLSDHYQQDDPFYFEFCSAYTENGVLTGDIMTIG